MEGKFIRQLLSTMKCGICGQRYEASNIQVLGHRDDLWFLGVYCSTCRSQGLVAAVIKEGRLPELVTDLTEEEFSKFSRIDSVGVDDMLDLHNFLKDFDGDFSQLFGSKRGPSN